MNPLKSWAVVSDFDGTLLPKEALSTIHMVKKSGGLRPDILEKTSCRHRRYLDMSLKGRLSDEEELSWLMTDLDAFICSDLTETTVRNALRDARLRPGAVETLRYLRDNGIPVAVISFGIAPFIRVVLEQNGAADLVSAVLAAELVIDRPSGRYVNYRRETLVTPANKGLRSRRFAAAHGVSPTRILAVADSYGDRTLGHRRDLRLGLAQDEAEAANLSAIMGEVIVTDTFYPVLDWLRHHLSS